MVYGSGANNVSEVLIPDPGAVPQAEYLLPGRPTFRDVDLTAFPKHQFTSDLTFGPANPCTNFVGE